MAFNHHSWPVVAFPVLLSIPLFATAQWLSRQQQNQAFVEAVKAGQALETMVETPRPAPVRTLQYSVPAILSMRQPQGFNSVQANVAAGGLNIVGDAANEPSIAVNPNNTQSIAIGWRHFDSIASGFREAGVAFSTDGGAQWTFTSVIDNGVFRSDPVLAADGHGVFYYQSLRVVGNDFTIQQYTSSNGGQSWSAPVEAFGGDKSWYALDNTGGMGDGHIYAAWNTAGNNFFPATFNRSVDSGQSFEDPIEIPQRPRFGTVAVGPNGELYVVGQGNSGQFWLLRSDNAQDALTEPVFNQVTPINLGGGQAIGGIVNPVGLLGQIWVAADHSDAPSRGNVYVLASADPPGSDPLDVMFIRSVDGGQTFSTPLRVNDDGVGNNAWQWFGSMSVAPDGRIDVIWNDTRNDGAAGFSELFYSYSMDGGLSFSANQAASPAFNHSLGYPTQDKLGDYYDIVSDRHGAHIAYAATFNGEQDVYYLYAQPEGADLILADGFE